MSHSRAIPFSTCNAFILPRFLSLFTHFWSGQSCNHITCLIISFIISAQLTEMFDSCARGRPVSPVKLQSTNTFLGSPETYPGRDVRADTKGGSTTLGHPMWKRLQEVTPWDILPVIRWDQQKDRGLYSPRVCNSVIMLYPFYILAVLLQPFRMISYGCPAQPFYVIFIWLQNQLLITMLHP